MQKVSGNGVENGRITSTDELLVRRYLEMFSILCLTLKHILQISDKYIQELRAENRSKPP